jgi:5-methylthioribose kinase
MGRFVARIAFWTSDFGLDSGIRKMRAAAATNAELCRITEDLVFTEPYVEHPNNHFPDAIRSRVDELRANGELLTEIADLKHRFMTHGEALIHGDLHTGSVMVGGDRAVAFDLEFCFYGPVAFDLGALWANFILAAARAHRLQRPNSFVEDVDGLMERSWGAFVSEFERLWPLRVDRAFDDAFKDRYLASVWVDGLGFAAAKAIRRIVGLAHVSDIETLPEPLLSNAADAVLRTGWQLAIRRRALPDPRSAWRMISDEIRS